MTNLAITENKNLIPELIPVSKWNEYFPYPSVASIRQYIFYKRRNGFDKVLRWMGKRQYICVAAFNEWVENGTGEKAAC
ncbi:MAG: hypothetical protein PHV37_07445 [Candidatus Gastranaerophilales bacterium]|nr:hypothetical protein [Candidatus Gastranaerophilales bacterium]